MTDLECEVCRGVFVLGEEVVASDAELDGVSIGGRVNGQRRSNGTRLEQLDDRRRRGKFRRVVIHVQNFQRHLRTVSVSVRNAAKQTE